MGKKSAGGSGSGRPRAKAKGAGKEGRQDRKRRPASANGARSNGGSGEARKKPKTKPVSNLQDDHDAVEPGEEDVDFVKSLVQSSQGKSFLQAFEKADFGKEADPNHDEIIEKHESKPRTLAVPKSDKKEAEPKHRVPLLPVKNEDGGLEAAVEPPPLADPVRPTPEPTSSARPPKGDGGGGASTSKATATEKASKDSRKPKILSLADVKKRIAICSITAIDATDSKGEESLNVLLDYARSQDLQICQLAMLSLQAVFKDILPNYMIKAIDESDLVLSKEVRKQHNFESMLLRTYQSFLRVLFKKSKSGIKQVRVTACKCACKLLRANYMFNYRSDLLKQVVPLMNSKISEVATVAVDCVEDLFRIDNDGEATLEVLQLIADYIRRSTNCSLNGRMIDIIRVIRLSDDLTKRLLQAEEDDSVHISRKEKQRRANDRRRRRDAALAEGKDVDYHLGTATQGVREKMKVQTKIIEGMFECIFRVLKNFKDDIAGAREEEEEILSKKFSWLLLSSTLACLGKFSVYINIDFMSDLFNWLYAIAGEAAVPTAQKFQCLMTVYEILDGPGKALNIDTLRFDARLYDLLLEAASASLGTAGSGGSDQGAGEGSACARSVQMALLFRRVMDRKRVINFVKRICMRGLGEARAEEVLGSIHLLARLLQRYASTRMLLDNDEVNTVYSCSDFEATLDLHGKDTCPLWELSLLGEHFHPHVASSVAAVLSKTTSVSDIMKDPSSILNVNDVGEIFGEYKTREGHFNPAPPRKPFKKTLKKRNNAPEGDLESEAEEVTDHQAKVGLVTLFLRNN